MHGRNLQPMKHRVWSRNDVSPVRTQWTYKKITGNAKTLRRTTRMAAQNKLE
jgi:hypothetical protein